MTDSDADASIYPFPDEKPDTLPLFCKWLLSIILPQPLYSGGSASYLASHSGGLCWMSSAYWLQPTGGGPMKWKDSHLLLR